MIVITWCVQKVSNLWFRKNTFIHIEQIYSNLLQSSPLGNADTYPSGPTIVGNTSGTLFL
jgi:hypothetical protein